MIALWCYYLIMADFLVPEIIIVNVLIIHLLYFLKFLGIYLS